MKSVDLLKEVLKDPILSDKYHIPQGEIAQISFDSQSPYRIIEVLKTIIQQKCDNMPDSAVYKNLKNILEL